MNDCTQLQEIVSNDNAFVNVLEYRINDKITLAGQPEPEDWLHIAQQGFNLIINIRSDPERAAIQAGNAEAEGLRHIHLLLPAYELEPHHLEQFHQIVQQNKAEKIYLHCHTASRTALLWMLIRIIYDGYTQEEAETELRQAGYDEESMEAFSFCAEDYFERAVTLELILI